MAKSNLSQHEQLLKTLEKSIREICEKQNEVFATVNRMMSYESLDKGEQQNALYQTSSLMEMIRNKTMLLFVIADDLRTTRLNFEKENTDKDSVGQQVRTWWKKWWFMIVSMAYVPVSMLEWVY